MVPEHRAAAVDGGILAVLLGLLEPTAAPGAATTALEQLADDPATRAAVEGLQLLPPLVVLLRTSPDLRVVEKVSVRVCLPAYLF
jgi:hypothetical protein